MLFPFKQEIISFTIMRSSPDVFQVAWKGMDYLNPKPASIFFLLYCTIPLEKWQKGKGNSQAPTLQENHSWHLYNYWMSSQPATLVAYSHHSLLSLSYSNYPTTVFGEEFGSI